MISKISYSGLFPCVPFSHSIPFLGSNETTHLPGTAAIISSRVLLVGLLNYYCLRRGPGQHKISLQAHHIGLYTNLRRLIVSATWWWWSITTLITWRRRSIILALLRILLLVAHDDSNKREEKKMKNPVTVLATEHE